MTELNIKKLMEEHPLTGEMIIVNITSFIKGLQESMLADLPEEQKASAELPILDRADIINFIDETIGKSSSLQMLTEIFDTQDVYVCSIYNSKTNWEYSINSHVGEGTYTSRMEANIIGLSKAFEFLENKLKEESDENQRHTG